MFELLFALYFIIGSSIAIICDYHGWLRKVMNRNPLIIIVFWPWVIAMCAIIWFDNRRARNGAYLFRK